MQELPKKYDPDTIEPKWQEYWIKNKTYAFKKSEKETYSIDTPPPYASADHLHVGHGMHYSQFEFVARFQRMRGKNVFFPMGYDDNGLPTERYVEKKHNINKSKTTRAEFIKLCLEETKKTGETYYHLFTQLGFSIDWNLLYQTIGPEARRVAQKSFIDLFNKNRLEHTDHPTMWCTTCQTTIAQADLENVDLNSQFSDIIFKQGEKKLIIATTRPEMIPACVALFYHPDDERYRELEGKKAKVPLVDYEVPILADEKVEKDKGTGLMMVCTFGDKEDVEKWQKHKLDLRVILTEYGKLNELAKDFAGMKIKEARKAILAALQEKGLIKNQKQISHAVNVHERCNTEIEFLKTKQWQIKVLDKKEELITLGRKVNWYPEHMRTRYEHWVQGLQWNWGISRQRYYGVPFPVWYCKDCSKVIVPDESELPVDPREEKAKRPCVCGSENIEPEMDVMDTWMTSSCTPEINAKWGSKAERSNFLPMSLRPQAHDIIRTWAFYTIVKSYYHHNNIPWKDIMISGHGLDPKGQKMSKSRGNFVVARDVIKKYSADAFRFWAASTKLGEDLAYQEKDVVTGQKLMTKLWNSSRFCFMHLKDYNYTKPEHLLLVDAWMLTKINQLIREATEAFEQNEYSKVKSSTHQLFWHTFCDNYLEFVKDRLYNPEKYDETARSSAQFTLFCSLRTIIKLLAPIMPHITEELYQAYFKEIEKYDSIHISPWPEEAKEYDNKQIEKTGDIFADIVGTVRKYKSTQNVSLKTPIETLTIDCDEDTKRRLQQILQDIKAVTKTDNIVFGAGSIECNEVIKLGIALQTHN